MSRADATDGRGRKKGRGEAEEVPQEETGWLDDLRGAKQAKDQFEDADFTDGGSSRWDKLSALSEDAPAGRAPGAPAGPVRRRDEAPRAAPDDPRVGARRPLKTPRREPACPVRTPRAAPAALVRTPRAAAGAPRRSRPPVAAAPTTSRPAAAVPARTRRAVTVPPARTR